MLKLKSKMKPENIIVQIALIMVSGWHGDSYRILPAHITLATLITFILIYCYLRDGKICVPAKVFVYVTIHIVAIIFTRLFHSTATGWSVPILWALLDVAAILILLFYRNNAQRFIADYLKIFRIITLISLFGFLFINKLHLITLPKIYYGNASYEVFYPGIIYGYRGDGSRNCGLYWEPGVFAEYLALACFFELIVRKKRIRDISIYLLAMITTKSTIGYIMIAIILCMRFLHNKSAEMNTFSRIACVSVVTAIAFYLEQFILFLAQIMPSVFGKITNRSVNFTARLYGPRLMLDVFLERPFVGVGYIEAVTKFMKKAKMVGGIDTAVDTITLSLASMGIGGIMPVLLLLYGAIRQKGMDVFEHFLLVILMTVVIYSEPHTSQLFIWVFGMFLAVNNYLVINKRE